MKLKLLLGASGDPLVKRETELGKFRINTIKSAPSPTEDHFYFNLFKRRQKNI